MVARVCARQPRRGGVVACVVASSGGRGEVTPHALLLPHRVKAEVTVTVTVTTTRHRRRRRRGRRPNCCCCCYCCCSRSESAPPLVSSHPVRRGPFPRRDPRLAARSATRRRRRCGRGPRRRRGRDDEDAASALDRCDDDRCGEGEDAARALDRCLSACWSSRLRRGAWMDVDADENADAGWTRTR